MRNLTNLSLIQLLPLILTSKPNGQEYMASLVYQRKLDSLGKLMTSAHFEPIHELLRECQVERCFQRIAFTPILKENAFQRQPQIMNKLLRAMHLLQGIKQWARDFECDDNEHEVERVFNTCNTMLLTIGGKNYRHSHGMQEVVDSRTLFEPLLAPFFPRL